MQFDYNNMNRKFSSKIYSKHVFLSSDAGSSTSRLSDRYRIPTSKDELADLVFNTLTLRLECLANNRKFAYISLLEIVGISLSEWNLML